MKLKFAELLEKLGAPYELGADDAMPVALYDDDTGATYSAEIRTGSERRDVDCEIQVIHGSDLHGEQAVDHVCVLRCLPMYEGFWNVASFQFRGQKPGQDVYDWESKACTFFRGVVAELSAGRVPNIDEIHSDAFRDKDSFHDQRGSGAGKAPKIKPGQMLNMKGGRGF